MVPMVDVRVDHTLIEQALSTLSRYCYIPDLRLSQRAPLEELQRVVREASVERTVTDTSVMVCSGCGYRVDACPECGGTDSENPSTLDAEGVRVARSAPIDFTPVDCDEPDASTNCRCSACHGARVARDAERTREFQARREQQRRERARRESAPQCRTCATVLPSLTDLARHITEHNDYCGLCGWYNGGSAPETMREHMLEWHPICTDQHDGDGNECNLFFRAIEQLVAHQQAMGRRQRMRDLLQDRPTMRREPPTFLTMDDIFPTPGERGEIPEPIWVEVPPVPTSNEGLTLGA